MRALAATAGGRAKGLGRAIVTVACLAAVAGCTPSEAEEVADLCRDLGSFGGTFELLLGPPDEATLGEVRGALEKVAPFLGRMADVEATPAALDDELRAVEEGFRDALEGLGDDEPATVAAAGLELVRPRLQTALAEAASALGCAPLRAGAEATV